MASIIRVRLTAAAPLRPGTNVGNATSRHDRGEVFMHKFGATTTLTEDFTFYPDLSDFSQYRFALDSGLVTKINKWLGWQTTFSDRYVTESSDTGNEIQRCDFIDWPQHRFHALAIQLENTSRFRSLPHGPILQTAYEDLTPPAR